ncbi:PTS sugar transporter subunit IIB [Biostraticola tofi]|uniref:PTS system IIB component (L-Asc family) n=1 Tax=Biostraticola tofi TaxID=466109 RepID=A0A4R3Z421_9GAMM|nr:PTS sugar transporter subunit IIB [Biostraticola tofi]TCV99916.1 PTS system IIB component (L-Asc family) [Biostraticola tofi]
MKIMAVCGAGLGSSFMMEMNIKKVIKNLNITAEVEHSDLGSVTPDAADVFVMGRDIAYSANLPESKLIIVNSIIDIKELETKLSEYFQNK